MVTGAGRGIGRALAMALAVEGAAVVMSARTEADLIDVARGIVAAGGKASPVVADATDPVRAREPVRTAVAEFGR
ncbi:MAG: 7-alpha-hydroxysteroid dehydrogenase, partial [Micromonosporaceae bacterium]|nr:7-alpha-hydroxysteroid dehydrogenase [Micromonosporaceae bacterium]